jgi:hypothetical protein
MSSPVSYLPTCHICKKPVELEPAKTDESGRAVHSGCYCSRSTAKRLRLRHDRGKATGRGTSRCPFRRAIEIALHGCPAVGLLEQNRSTHSGAAQGKMRLSHSGYSARPLQNTLASHQAFVRLSVLVTGARLVEAWLDLLLAPQLDFALGAVLSRGGNAAPFDYRATGLQCCKRPSPPAF